MNKQHGFTIIELMIATLIFSVIMLVAAAGILRFSHDYFKGVNSSDTQQVARSIMNDISQNIQYGKKISISDGSSGMSDAADGSTGLCVDGILYSYKIGAQVLGTSHSLLKTLGSDCSAAKVTDVTTTTTLASDTRELVSDHMRLGALDVKAVGYKLYSIHLKVIYGDDDLLTDPSDYAKTGCISNTGSQFCAIAELDTTVNQRQ